MILTTAYESYVVEGYELDVLDYLLIHTPAGRIITLMTFARIMQMLPEDRFCRVHKSYVVSIGAIEKVDKNAIIIRDKRIPLGITNKNSFQKQIDRRMPSG